LKLVVRQMNTTFLVLRIRGVFVPKNCVLQARITDDTHEKLTRICSGLDCSVTDYVIGVLDESFEDSTSIAFEFSDDHPGWKYWLDHIHNC